MDPDHPDTRASTPSGDRERPQRGETDGAPSNTAPSGETAWPEALEPARPSQATIRSWSSQRPSRQQRHRSTSNPSYERGVDHFDDEDNYEAAENAVELAAPRRSGVLPSAAALRLRAASAPNSPSILEEYAKTLPVTAACRTAQKQCLFPDCTNMAVSKGLCRRHGGGRRCQFSGGCTKSAQSRSTFCWAHGGGLRCDVQGCMRARKSKHFCVAHLHLEEDIFDSDSSSSTQSTPSANSAPRGTRSRHGDRARVDSGSGRAVQSPPVLPSLNEALNSALESLQYPAVAQQRGIPDYASHEDTSDEHSAGVRWVDE